MLIFFSSIIVVLMFAVTVYFIVYGMCNFINGLDNATFKFSTLIREFNENIVKVAELTSILITYIDTQANGGVGIPVTILQQMAEYRHKLIKTRGDLRWFRRLYSAVIESHPYVFDIGAYEEAAKLALSKSNDALSLLSERMFPAETGILKRGERLPLQTT
jgi:hypothetical protein